MCFIGITSVYKDNSEVVWRCQVDNLCSKIWEGYTGTIWFFWLPHISCKLKEADATIGDN